MKIRTVTILAVFTLTFACAIPSAIADPAKPIKIGVVGAHSGDLACYGLPTLKAAQLIVKDINEQGGINGRPVELLVEDDVCKPEIATIIAAKFVSAGVHAVIGHTCSGPTKAALPIYRAASIPVVSPSATSSSLTQNDEYPNFFRTIAADDAQARTQVDFA
ncbi:MAG: branched-chain amino acid ABC transporter substrate-binding protein, partial [Desulfobulbus sp.]|nr:branched-chain amino acid ABC transporter substrate-binding protein [Desulfobulbus sp.]